MATKLRERKIGSQQPLDRLATSLKRCRDDLLQGDTGMSPDQFGKCVSKALKDEHDKFRHRHQHRDKRSTCKCFFKTLWICLLVFLAFCLIAVGYKPVAFQVHKVYSY